MGLVVQTTASLLPIQLPAESEASQAGLLSGVFARLLAAAATPEQVALTPAGTAPGNLPGALGDPLALIDAPAAPPEGSEASPGAGDLAGAVAAALALVSGAAPAVADGPPVAPDGAVHGVAAADATTPGQLPHATPAGAGATGELATAVPEPSALPVEPSTGESLGSTLTAPSAEPSQGLPAETVMDVSLATASDQPAGGNPNLAATASGVDSSPAGLAPAPVTGEGEAQFAPHAAGTRTAPAGALPEQPPGGAGTDDRQPPGDSQSDAMESVVRFAGNAIDRSRTEGITAAPGSRENTPLPGARTTPKASEQGVAHAAAGSAVGRLREAPPPAAAAPGAAPAPAPSPAPPPQIDQAGTAIIERVEAGGGEATIHLEPAELGEVRIRVRIDSGVVHVDVHTSRPEAAQLFRDHTVDLTSLLGSRGLDLAGVFVGGGGDQAGHGQGQGTNQGRQSAEPGFASLLGFEEPALAERHNRLRAAYNPDGAHVYRI